ncbi:MAG: toll/interleukin-1 receptor domain-containing protein [Candidatus Thiodiazotropha sp.]|jgi:hypothetical protein
MPDIFLSYRRADAPGYVGRLADSLEARFGDGTVFRDVDSLRGGNNWKKALSRAISEAQLVIAIIGPQWQKLLQDRQGEEADWVSFELNQARALDIPVIPLVLGNAIYKPDSLPAELAWLADVQSSALADGQGRWNPDIARLVQDVAALTTLKPLQPEKSTPAISQASQGNQSPNIDSGGGDVTINFGTEPEGD